MPNLSSDMTDEEYEEAIRVILDAEDPDNHFESQLMYEKLTALELEEMIAGM